MFFVRQKGERKESGSILETKHLQKRKKSLKGKSLGETKRLMHISTHCTSLALPNPQLDMISCRQIFIFNCFFGMVLSYSVFFYCRSRRIGRSAEQHYIIYFQVYFPVISQISSTCFESSSSSIPRRVLRTENQWTDSACRLSCYNNPDVRLNHGEQLYSVVSLGIRWFDWIKDYCKKIFVVYGCTICWINEEMLYSWRSGDWKSMWSGIQPLREENILYSRWEWKEKEEWAMNWLRYPPSTYSEHWLFLDWM